MRDWYVRCWIRATWPLVVLIYKAWGRWWIDDDQCRRYVTAVMGATLWLAGRPVKTDAP